MSLYKVNRNARPAVAEIGRLNRQSYGAKSMQGLDYVGPMPIGRTKKESPLSLIGEGLLLRVPLVISAMGMGLVDLDELKRYIRRAG